MTATATSTQQDTFYRQGDVVLKVVPSLPDGAALRKDKGDVVLRHGSATGHMHKIRKGAAVFKHSDKEYLSVEAKSASLVHEEHATIKLPKGTYEILQQREYSPQEIRNVMD